MFLFPRLQMRPPLAPVVGCAGSGPVAAAEPVPVVAGAAAGYQRRRQRRRERGEGGRGGEGGMRADIGGVGGPAATPAQASRRSGAGSPCCWRRRRVSGAAPASAGAGRGKGGGGRGRVRASDIGGVSVSAATPALGLSQQQRLLPILQAPPPSLEFAPNRYLSLDILTYPKIF